MKIKAISEEEYMNFAVVNPLKNYMQTSDFAHVMAGQGFAYDYIGLVDGEKIEAVSLIASKKIGNNMRFGYAPKGFLINYYDNELMKNFVEELKLFFPTTVFIKINPEIVIGEIDPHTLERTTNANLELKNQLQKLGFKNLKDNLYFESVEPRLNAYIDLLNNDETKYSKTTKNKIRNAKRKGLYIEEGKLSDLETFTSMTTRPTLKTYFRNMYSIFSKDDKIDLLLVKVDYETYLKNSQDLYEKEEKNNNLLNEILHRRNDSVALNKKMNSDTRLASIKNEIIEATEGLRTKPDTVVACALVVKEGNRVHIVDSAFDRNYKNLNANYFLYDQIINNYKLDYAYLDLGGITADMSPNNPYRGLNRFKMGFNPKIYEYIGELDLVLNKSNYDYLLKSGRLAEMFNKIDVPTKEENVE